MSDLIKRVESASEGDRELDGDICVALDGGGEIVWKQANYTMEAYPARKVARANYVGGIAYEHVPHYTASLDAAIALCARALPGTEIEISTLYGIPSATVGLNDSVNGQTRATAATLPLALVLAILRAHPDGGSDA